MRTRRRSSKRFAPRTSAPTPPRRAATRSSRARTSDRSTTSTSIAVRPRLRGGARRRPGGGHGPVHCARRTVLHLVWVRERLRARDAAARRGARAADASLDPGASAVRAQERLAALRAR
jgi:hypothetical protein